jgi:hypothetical protein
VRAAAAVNPLPVTVNLRGSDATVGMLGQERVFSFVPRNVLPCPYYGVTPYWRDPLHNKEQYKNIGPSDHR